MSSRPIQFGADVVDAGFHSLDAGASLMKGKYTVTSLLDSDDDSFTYLAQNALGQDVVVIECFPRSLCRRNGSTIVPHSASLEAALKSDLHAFAHKAMSLGKLKHPNIVPVRQVFGENRTAYVVLESLECQTLRDVLRDSERKLKPATVQTMLQTLLGALDLVHAQGILHLNISPFAILLDAANAPVLGDFALTGDLAGGNVKDGYAPLELLFADRSIGPAADLFSLGATFYRLITGRTPPDSRARLDAITRGEADPYRPLAKAAYYYHPDFRAAIDKALALFPEDRPQSAAEWLETVALTAPQDHGFDATAKPAEETVVLMAPEIEPGQQTADLAADLGMPAADPAPATAAAVIPQTEVAAALAAAPMTTPAPALDEEMADRAKVNFLSGVIAGAAIVLAAGVISGLFGSAEPKMVKNSAVTAAAQIVVATPAVAPLAAAGAVVEGRPGSASPAPGSDQLPRPAASSASAGPVAAQAPAALPTQVRDDAPARPSDLPAP